MMTVLKFIKILILNYDWFDRSSSFVADIYEIPKGPNLGTLCHIYSDVLCRLSAHINVCPLSKYFMMIL